MDFYLSILTAIATLVLALGGILLGLAPRAAEPGRVGFQKWLAGKEVLFLRTAVAAAVTIAVCEVAQATFRQGEAEAGAARLRSFEAIPTPKTTWLTGWARPGIQPWVIDLAIVGEGAYADGRYSQALGYFLEADRYGGSASLKARIADSYYKEGNWEAVVRYEKEAMELSPEWSGPPYLLGFAYLHLSDSSAAGSAFQRSCDLGFGEGCLQARFIKSQVDPDRNGNH